MLEIALISFLIGGGSGVYVSNMYHDAQLAEIANKHEEIRLQDGQDSSELIEEAVTDREALIHRMEKDHEYFLQNFTGDNIKCFTTEQLRFFNHQDSSTTAR